MSNPESFDKSSILTPRAHGMLCPVQDNSEWQVVDAGSVVAHVFLEGYREEYDLEGLWGLPNRSNIRWLKPKATVHTLDTIRAA